MPHVIIADDDETMRYLVQQIVGSLGWTFDVAADGVEALEVMERAMPDLVITDVGMPRMNGIDLLLAIKGDPRFANVPVVIMSSINRELEAREAGCAAFIAKPFSVDALLDLLSQVLEGETPS